ncbi:hypothetical protein LIER_20209 [Lithospermum erythrorhizon]|uniref:DUF4283 domain-containing protein n=1 Tax=Lithospermum erythrorhizon TaxID=34254 RepID=A0AAV3QNP1_LITER
MNPSHFAIENFVKNQWRNLEKIEVYKLDPGLKLDRKCIESLPIWIKLPGLALEYLDMEMLSRIASAIGKPLFPDVPTAEMVRLSFARVCVEISTEATLPKMVKLRDELGRVIEQEIEYEWLPFCCKKCQLFGHKIEECREKVTTQYVRKEEHDVNV